MVYPVSRHSAKMYSNELSSGNQSIQIDTGFDSEAVEHVEQVFSSNISGRAFGIGATAETGNGTIYDGDTSLQCRKNIGQRLTVGVMKMHRQLRNRYLLADRIEHCLSF